MTTFGKRTQLGKIISKVTLLFFCICVFNLNTKVQSLIDYFYIDHTTYSRNNIGQKCEGNCGLWVLNEMIKKMYPENLKKIVGAVWELPAK